MKKLILFLLAFAFLSADPKICLNMIVKNESKVIERCLASVIPLIDYWVIVDTGSTDGTQEIIKKFMKEIPGELHERPWVNFAHNRNEALQLAKNTADYLLFIDADDVLSYTPGFEKPLLDKDSYLMNIYYSGLTYARTQLIRSELDWYWDGVVHEVLVCNDSGTSGDLEGVTMVILGGGDRSHDPNKFLKDAKALEEALENDPENARYTFYLAQSYRDAEKPELALKYYEQRVALGGWDQEMFWSLYQIAELQENLKFSDDLVSKGYYKAFKFRPTRAEPLYRLAQYFRLKENYFLAYLVAQHGLHIQHPSDILFVESWIYDYGLLLEYSISAYWIGRYEESFQACIQLLSKQSLPLHVVECVQRNLKFAVEKIPK